MDDSRADIGIIGGSGFYKLHDIPLVAEVELETPFGAPSGSIVIGDVGGLRMAFLARHGRGHRLPPAEVPARANIFALKTLGVHTVIGIHAVGSLHERIAPGHLALPDDLFDRTSARPASFFGPGLVVHIPFAQPFCPQAHAALLAAASATETTVHDGGTLVVIDGPRFSTRAENAFYRLAGCQYVGMTALPEAALAREAELCYASVSVITDSDAEHAPAGVTRTDIAATLRLAVGQARRLLAAALPALAAISDCDCRHALAHAIATAPKAIDPTMAQQLDPIVGRYLSPDP